MNPVNNAVKPVDNKAKSVVAPATNWLSKLFGSKPANNTVTTTGGRRKMTRRKNRKNTRKNRNRKNKKTRKH